MNPATNAAAIAMTTTQTQVETPASFFSSISITSLVVMKKTDRTIMETGFLYECEE